MSALAPGATAAPRPAREHEFGEVLVDAGFIDERELASALDEQAQEAALGHWELLGSVLMRWHLITEEQLETSLLAQAIEHQHLHFAGTPHSSVTSVLKRSMDIAGALVGLGLTAAVLPWVAGAISLEDGGPILFRQSRVGLHGRQFGILKFRTMIPDADCRKASIESDSPLFFSAKVDRRITRVGSVLRKTLLDELPQFWNVLVGEMSLVGTRPPTLDEVWHYDERHWSRLGVKAGMTGMWQVCEDRHAKSFEDVVGLDLEYHRRWSLVLDVFIIARTALGALEKLRHA
jgi:lipopolysaccharide/colanic/teichoic acid biosynthesis glycosyltransferase